VLVGPCSLQPAGKDFVCCRIATITFPLFDTFFAFFRFMLQRHYDQYSREIRIKKLDYECERRMASEVNVLQPQEQEPMKGLEWESVVLHTPTKHARGRRPSLTERLQQVGSEETNKE
jgi:hypothetical protein